MCKSAKSYKKKCRKSNKFNPMAQEVKSAVYYPIENGQRVCRIKGRPYEKPFSKWF